jgi:hypothetical protein
LKIAWSLVYEDENAGGRMEDWKIGRSGKMIAGRRSDGDKAHRKCCLSE